MRHHPIAQPKRRKAALANQRRQARIPRRDVLDRQRDALGSRVVWPDIRQESADGGPGAVSADDEVECVFAVGSEIQLRLGTDAGRPGGEELVAPFDGALWDLGGENGQQRVAGDLGPIA